MAGGHGHRIPGEGAGLVHGAERGQVVHDLGGAAQGGRGHAAADHLAEAPDVRGPALGLSGQAPAARGGGAEAGEHLVPDQQRAVAAGDLAQERVEALGGLHDAHVAGHGLRDERGDALAVLGEHGLDGGAVVVVHHEGLGGGGLGDARGAGQGGGRHARAGRGQQAVRVAVVAAGELHDQVAAGHAAGQAQGRHGGLGAGGHEAHALDRDLGGDQLGQRGLLQRGGAEAEAAVHGGVHGLDDLGVLVAQQHGAPRADQVHVLVALDVGQVRAACAGHEPGRAAHRAEGAHG